MKPDLQHLAEKYKALPNQGPALRVLSDGTISNGYMAVAHFQSEDAAKAALRESGFVESQYGWKVK